MRIINRINTHLNVKEAGRLINQQIFILARSGYGKTLLSEAISEAYYQAGAVVLVLADPKRQSEYGYAMFEPTTKYHLDHLKKIGKPIKKFPVKLYHPFNFNIPKKKLLPDINFYTFSLKDLDRRAWSMLAEKEFDSDTIRLLVQASENIGKDDGIYQFVRHIEEKIKGIEGKRNIIPDKQNFYLVASSGTIKSVGEISTYIQPFKKNYFLCNDSSPLKLNWSKILNDNKHYHVFLSNWISDSKLRDFIVLVLLNQIIENQHLIKKSILLVLPEIKVLVPAKSSGHKKFLAQTITEALSMIRSSGRGMSSCLDTQTYSQVNEEVMNSSTTTLIGQLSGIKDIERLVKSMNYNKDVRDQLIHPDYPNSYLILGKEKESSFVGYFPSHAHAEAHLNFFEEYHKYYPEKERSYGDLIKDMKQRLSKEESQSLEKVKEMQLRFQKEAKQKEKEKYPKFETKIKEKNYSKEKKKNQEKRCYNLRKKGLSYRAIARKEGIDSKTAKQRILDYEQIKHKGGKQKK